jgi:hypothetical protein
VLLVILIVICLTKLFLAHLGIEDIRVDASSPVELESKDENSLVLSKKLRFYNEGKQCATIMDAICRSQLPYEQYDGIDARGKAELEGAPREDDYFEAVLIQRKGDVPDKLDIWAKIALTPRKGLSLEEALAHMVDIGVDFIWMETGRTPWKYKKVRLELAAEDIARLAGVTLVKD